MPVGGGFQGLTSSLYNPIAFIPDVFSMIFKVFQGDVLLLGVLLELDLLVGLGVVADV